MWTLQAVTCDQCRKFVPAQYHLTMSDASVRNFCSYGCVMKFQAQFQNPAKVPPQQTQPQPQGPPPLKQQTVTRSGRVVQNRGNGTFFISFLYMQRMTEVHCLLFLFVRFFINKFVYSVRVCAFRVLECSSGWIFCSACSIISEFTLGQPQFFIKQSLLSCRWTQYLLHF